MVDFDLRTFLTNHKPKHIEESIEPYLKCNKLKHYTLLKHTNRIKLVPAHTYIKYIKVSESFVDRQYDNHVRTGGVLLSGGILSSGKYKKISKQKIWTHLLIKFIERKDPEDRTRPTSKIFLINLSKYYVFFKVFKESLRDTFSQYLLV